MKNERLEALKQAATAVAKSPHASSSVTYAIARDLWRVWWDEREAFALIGTSKS